MGHPKLEVQKKHPEVQHKLEDLIDKRSAGFMEVVYNAEHERMKANMPQMREIFSSTASETLYKNQVELAQSYKSNADIVLKEISENGDYKGFEVRSAAWKMDIAQIKLNNEFVEAITLGSGMPRSFKDKDAQGVAGVLKHELGVYLSTQHYNAKLG